ncbi:MAG: PLD nuclease N-terminal domain-containing protein [Flavihumibacter sp.]|nr:PLD nuclease N-terminal domain-containing protein [Flavihumibacter sp.]
MDILLPEWGLLLATSIICLLFLLFPLLCLISVLKNNFKDSTSKLIWVLVILFVPFMGSVLYLIIGRKQRV